MDDVSASVPLATQIASETLALDDSDANGFDITGEIACIAPIAIVASAWLCRKKRAIAF